MATCTTPRLRRGREVASTSARARPALARARSTSRCAGPWPSATSTTRQPSASQAARRRRARGRCRRGTPRPARGVEGHAPPRRRTPRVEVRAAARRPSPNGVSVHQARPAPAACSRTSASARNAAAPRSIGASPPAGGRAAQDASRNSWPVATRSCGAGADPLGVAAPRPRVAAAAGRPAAPSRADQRRAPATPCPRPAMPSASLSSISRSSGWSARRRAPRPARAPRRSSSSSRHGGAHSPSSAAVQERWSATENAADLLDLVAPELDPQRVLLGRREDVEDAAAHRELAAPLDQVDPGVAELDEPARRRRRGRRPSPDAQVDRLAGRPSPRTIGCSSAADRRDDHARRAPAAGSSSRDARAGAAPPAAGRRCPSAATAARAAASPRPGTRRRLRLGAAAQRSAAAGPRPRARSR